MKDEKRINLAKKIINNNIYLTLGTADNKIPWTAPLFYAVNNKYEFYFISKKDSLHIKHISNNPNVSFSIFDSHQKEGTGNGVQGSGISIRISDHEIEEALKWYKSDFIEMKKESFTGSAPLRFYKIIPDHFYILDPDEETDVRIEVVL